MTYVVIMDIEPDSDYQNDPEYDFVEAIDPPAGSAPDDFPQIKEALDGAPQSLQELYRYNWTNYPINRGPLFLVGEEMGLRVLESYNGEAWGRYADVFDPNPKEEALIDAVRKGWNEDMEADFNSLCWAEDELAKKNGWY